MASVARGGSAFELEDVNGMMWSLLAMPDLEARDLKDRPGERDHARRAVWIVQGNVLEVEIVIVLHGRVQWLVIREP
jgi:hypothetical protein